MGLFKKRCEYCKNKIDKGSEIKRHVKDPAFVGTKKKIFCCKEHADSYEAKAKKSKKYCSCCG